MPSVLEVKFDKGFNGAVNSFSAPPGHCLTMSDYELNYGVLQPRERSKKLCSSALSFVGLNLFYWRDNAGFTGATQGFLYYVGSGGIFRSSAAYNPSNDGSITFSDVSNSLGAITVGGNFAVLNNILVFAGNSSNKMIQVTSNSVNPTALTGPGIAPAALRTVNNFMFASATAFGIVGSANYSRVFWSNVADPTTWTASNYVDVNLSDGDAVTALGTLGSNLIIFKTRSSWLLNTTTTTISGAVTLGPLNHISSSIGCVYYEAVDNMPDGRCIFMGSDLNVYVTDGTSFQSLTNEPPPGSNVISDLFQGSPTVTGLRYYSPRNEIHVSVTNSSGTFIWAYDIQQSYWRKITSLSNIALAVSSTYSNMAQTYSLLSIDGSLGNIINVVKDRTAPPSDNTNAAVTPDVSTAVQFAMNITSVSDLCLSIIYSATATVTYNIGFDGTFGSTNYTLPIKTGRYDTKVPIISNSTNQRPTTFMIRFKGSTADFSIFKVYLSDEMGA